MAEPCFAARPAGWTPLHWAAWNGPETLALVLLEEGPNVKVNEKNNTGDSALHLAAERVDQAVAEILLAQGAMVDVKNDRGRTPLHWAANGGHQGIVELLLRGGAKLNEKTNAGETPLHFAAREGRQDVVETLVRAGAELQERTNCGEFTPLHWASKKGHRSIVDFLVAAGADWGSPDDTGETAEDKAPELFRGAKRQACMQIRVLTVRAVCSQDQMLELTCTTVGGRVAARLRWRADAPAWKLPSAVIDEVYRTGFDGLGRPLLCDNLRLLKADATKVAVDRQAPSLAHQFGLMEEDEVKAP